MTMSSGALVHINSRFRAVYGYDQRIEAFGSTGMLISRNRQKTTLERYTADGITQDVPPYFFIDRYREAYAAELDAFVVAIETGAAPAIGAEDGRMALAIAYAGIESAKTGQKAGLAGSTLGQ